MMPEPVPFPSSFFSVSCEGNIYIVQIDRDRLTDEDNLEQFVQDLNLLVEKHEIMAMVLRLTTVRYMTSSAIGKLISLHRKINRCQGKLVLCELMPEVADTLEASRLLGYFAVENDLAAAIYALQAW